MAKPAWMPEVVLMVFLRREHRYAEAYEIAGVIGFAVSAQLSSAARTGEPAACLRQERRSRTAVSPRVAERARRKVRQSALRNRRAGAGRPACAARRKYEAAAAAYELVTQVSAADPEFLQKANSGSRRNVRPASKARFSPEEIRSGRGHQFRQCRSRQKRENRMKESIPGVKSAFGHWLLAFS